MQNRCPHCWRDMGLLQERASYRICRCGAFSVPDYRLKRYIKPENEHIDAIRASGGWPKLVERVNHMRSHSFEQPLSVKSQQTAG